ncbi:YEATS-associated helix-containing protein [Shewanella sp. AC91-MNA-CIBAN-0169]|uniref:YEATS-associated helix-containing protein n=1 Tax=Shewanella sp. AC91-MNA-CIBAN-0169 TaxID=3140466 RepID=UPI0033169D80
MADSSNTALVASDAISSVGAIHSPFVLMLVIGLLGGWLSWLNTDYDEKYCHRRLARNLVTGVLATFMVPLFLQMIGSNLLQEISPNNSPFYVFLGMCSAAAFVAQKFASSISDKMIQQASDKADSATKAAKQVSEKTLSIEIEQLKIQGSLFMMRKEFDQALLLMDEYLKHNPKDSRTLFRKAYCLKRIGRVSRALKEIDAAIQHAEKPNAILHFNKACYMAILKKPIEQIIDSLQKAYVLDSQDVKSAILEELKLEGEGDFNNIKDEQQFVDFMSTNKVS